MMRVFVTVLLLGLTGCSLLSPSKLTAPAFYVLESRPLAAVHFARTDSAGKARTLIVNPPQAAAGYESQHIIFVREEHRLEYFAHSEWVDPPAHMLGPLLAAAVEQTHAFGAVVLMPASAAGDVRLDTEIIRLQHSFQVKPSRVQFTLRATLTDDATRKVLASRVFAAELASPAETAQGGVAAANMLVQQVLAQLAQFISVGEP